MLFKTVVVVVAVAEVGSSSSILPEAAVFIINPELPFEADDWVLLDLIVDEGSALAAAGASNGLS